MDFKAKVQGRLKFDTAPLNLSGGPSFLRPILKITIHMSWYEKWTLSELEFDYNSGSL